METFEFYHNEIPQYIRDIAATPPMQRLKDVGMNCGCEYTSFERFARLGRYSRYTHSLGAGLIALHFTADPRAAAAALLHDVATPVFAHTVDFLNGDYLAQESTESLTREIICSSPVLMEVLERNGLDIADVEDYHRYPVADNASPRLSADRLEYTLGNMVNYGFASSDDAGRLYADLFVGRNEECVEELCFGSPEAAEEFALYALECAQVYTSPEDRYSMQILSEVLADALERGVAERADLNGTEPQLIALLESDSRSARAWSEFRGLERIVPSEDYPLRRRTVPAKKRRIDPIAAGYGRVSSYSSEFRRRLEAYLADDFSIPICAI